jgi:hypothetical protein
MRPRSVGYLIYLICIILHRTVRAGGRWVRAEVLPFQWGVFLSSSDYHKCLQVERQGMCRQYKGGPLEWMYDASTEKQKLFNGTIGELRQCMAGKRIVMVGDSLTRQQHKAAQCFLNQLAAQPALLEFVWCPYLLESTNSSKLCSSLEVLLKCCCSTWGTGRTGQTWVTNGLSYIARS